ncbi:DUF397 domain-containing protein [Streptomyces canus]|uniref:DUF397 domain-containing protein n=1 Tax=Streptomyces canus TaxID=58343 RepID=UPI00371EE891
MSVAPDLSTAAWRKSRHSHESDSACVEVADNLPGIVPVRDSKDPEGPALVFTRDAWAAFVADLEAARTGG